MTDRPSSGHYPHAGYDGLSTTTFAGDSSLGSYGSGYENGYEGGYATAYDSGYGAQQTASPAYEQAYDYDPYAAYAPQQSYDSGVYDATAWTGHDAPASGIPAQAAPHDTSAQWDAGAWNTDPQPTAYGYDLSGGQSGHWTMPGSTETGAYDATAWNSGTGSAYDGYDAQYAAPSHEAAYAPAPDATQVHPQQAYPAYDPQGGAAQYDQYDPYAQQQPLDGPHSAPAPAFEQTPTMTYVDLGAAALGHPDATHPAPGHSAQEVAFAAAATMVGELGIDFDLLEADAGPDAPYDASYDHDHDQAGGADPADDADELFEVADATALDIGPTPAPHSRAAARRGGAQAGAGNRGRRRTPAKRSALLTVAVPSACVMGVAGVAAASVGGLTGQQTVEEPQTLAAPDPASVKPVAANSKLDTQLQALSADAGDFADRASRTQERIDLRERQEQDRKRRAEEAARKEALRPKFALPVTQHGLSAGFGQSGVNWMSLHTGIDFPVSYGTPVMAATDGTVRTQWNSAYGNMAIVTAPDGTETWYCHLSSTKLRSGTVKAGEVIAYSGNSGNSTGPHLHFEVRPGGGGAINPLPWLRAHGLDPT
ncbi:M23 family metallopeptidase [Streptomyces sp. NRRL S-87]|uniref:M23 family metallopeptidase n=1 Tax=Streptomyces sp. NRRL S-87 TaxID=1463920 RepID=UPI00068B538B|nr:M23 family metallopeptidase [Streptomyces sp. NRRL S-87]